MALSRYQTKNTERYTPKVSHNNKKMEQKDGNKRPSQHIQHGIVRAKPTTFSSEK
jgi:hypothetical protein